MSNTTVKIDGVTVPSPTEWKPGFKDLVANSNRTGGGKMRFNYVATKRTWEGSWKNLTSSQLSVLLGAIEGKSFFTIECFDPGLNSVAVKTFYKGDRNFDTPKHISDNEVYFSLSITFIEQ